MSFQIKYTCPLILNKKNQDEKWCQGPNFVVAGSKAVGHVLSGRALKQTWLYQYCYVSCRIRECNLTISILRRRVMLVPRTLDEASYVAKWRHMAEKHGKRLHDYRSYIVQYDGRCTFRRMSNRMVDAGNPAEPSLWDRCRRLMWESWAHMWMGTLQARRWKAEPHETALWDRSAGMSWGLYKNKCIGTLWVRKWLFMYASCAPSVASNNAHSYQGTEITVHLHPVILFSALNKIFMGYVDHINISVQATLYT